MDIIRKYAKLKEQAADTTEEAETPRTGTIIFARVHFERCTLAFFTLCKKSSHIGAVIIVGLYILDDCETLKKNRD